MGFYSPLPAPLAPASISASGTLQLSEVVTSVSVSDEAITQAMGRCWDENQYLLCPHSAVAVSYHYQQMNRQQSRYGVRCGAQALGFQGPSSSLSPQDWTDGSPGGVMGGLCGRVVSEVWQIPLGQWEGTWMSWAPSWELGRVMVEVSSRDSHPSICVLCAQP